MPPGMHTSSTPWQGPKAAVGGGVGGGIVGGGGRVGGGGQGGLGFGCAPSDDGCADEAVVGRRICGLSSLGARRERRGARPPLRNS